MGAVVGALSYNPFGKSAPVQDEGVDITDMFVEALSVTDDAIVFLGWYPFCLFN